MIDENKLIEKRTYYPYPASDYEAGWNDCNRDWMVRIWEQPQVGGWIPASERLPEESGNYLVTSKGSTWVANWFNGAWWGIGKKCRWTDVEAWRPLPEPYKESEEE